MADMETLREIIPESTAKLIALDNPREDSRPRAFRSQATELSVAERQTSALEAIAKELKRYNDDRRLGTQSEQFRAMMESHRVKECE